jgi:hypothetical protein
VSFTGGTLAFDIAQSIEGTVFEVIDGARHAPVRAWPKDIVLDASDGLMASFGLGGIPPKIVLLGIAI